MKRKLNGINITYRYHKGKNQKTVLLLHGWGGNLNSFRFLENFLLENDFSVLALDFPGFGGSDEPKENFVIEDYYKIVDELLTLEKIEKVSIVAHSFGGRVALLLASQCLEKIDKLVLCDIAGIKPKFSFFRWVKIKRYKILKKLKEKGIIKRELLEYGSDDYKAMPKGLKNVFNNIINTDLTYTLKNINAPTLIIWGKDDKETPFYMAKKINKNIKGSAIITFEGGHFCYLTESKRFSLIVQNFLK